MKGKKNDRTPEAISGFVRQFQPIRILLTAYELGVFSAIGGNPKTSTQVAGKIHADPRATDRLLNALCVMGYLIKRKNRFSNTRETGKYLVKGKPEYMSGLMHQVHLWNSWTMLSESVRKGTSVLARPENVNDRDDQWLNAFIDAMHYRARENAAGVVKKINLKGVRNILDVGGGSGVYSMAFVKADKNVTAVVFDLPNVIPITKKYIRKEKLASRIKTAAGDYSGDKLPVGFDMVFLSAIVHSNSFRENMKLIKKCASSLNPGGRVIIKDQVMDESRIKPARGALFSLNMLVGTKGGDTYTVNEMKEWFAHAGLKFVKRINIENGNSMLVGKKDK